MASNLPLVYLAVGAGAYWAYNMIYPRIPVEHKQSMAASGRVIRTRKDIPYGLVTDRGLDTIDEDNLTRYRMGLPILPY